MSSMCSCVDESQGSLIIPSHFELVKKWLPTSKICINLSSKAFHRNSF